MKELFRGADRLKVAAYVLLIAACTLFICSRSSPGYPINDWADANIYLTIGKGMTQGKVVYRDLYDHKGPLLYALHALCALLSFHDFLGVYLMEVLFAAAFLGCAYKLLCLYEMRRPAWALLPVLALLVYTSLSFAQGDSAEEMCLPLAAYTLYHVLRHFHREDKRMHAGGLVLEGALFGCVFWIKFTMIGMQTGLLLVLLWQAARRRDWRELWRELGLLLAGFALSTLPWVVYFGLNGALVDWLKTYLYDNLFLYSAGEGAGAAAKLRAMAHSLLDWLGGNLRYTLLMALGLGWFVKRVRRAPWEAAAVAMAMGVGALCVFVGGKSYPYYGLALASLAPVVLMPVGCAIEKPFAALSKGRRQALSALVCAVCIALCPLCSFNFNDNVGVRFGQPRAQTMQYRFAEHIRKVPNATLLNYGFMDAGFYTAAGITPNVKYFHFNNVPLAEMKQEQERYIREGVCDFVVARGNEPKTILETYDLIDTAQTPGFWYDNVYLYRRKR